MRGSPTFRDLVESSRPPDAPKNETKAIFQIALRFRDQLAKCFDDIESDSFFLEDEDIDELAVALTELSEDLHCDAGLWRSLEAYHREFFGVFLPLLGKPGESVPETFDVRRFQFSLFSVWRHFQPEQIISPKIEEETISPAFVRRVIRDAGSTGLERLYFLSGSTAGIEYLLRRFKGLYYRKRYPCISLLDE